MGDAVRLSGRLVHRDVQNTVGNNIKGNFNLRDTTSARGTGGIPLSTSCCPCVLGASALLRILVKVPGWLSK